MYPQVYEIRLDSESSKYFAGQTVEGRVIIELKNEKVVKGILVRLIGKGNVYWDNGMTSMTSNVFTESEVYVNSTCELLIPEEKQVTLLPGAYEYCFCLEIPHNVPSSLEGQHGFVRYHVEAAIQRPWKDDQVLEKVIDITTVSELSEDSEVSHVIQKEKIVGFNVCQTGPIELNFMLGKVGFVPGEYLQFGAEIRNRSSTKINRILVSLKRQLNCHAKGETKSTLNKILKLNGPPSAEVGGYLLWQSNFEIPVLPPSELPGCGIISIQYFVEVKLVLEKWTDVKYYVPIIIGTTPYSSSNFNKQSESFAFESSNKTPTKLKSSLSRKNSIISPITGELFILDDHFDFDDSERKRISPPPKKTGMVHDLLFSSLPPLDLSFFQNNPERGFNSRSSYPYQRVMSTSDCFQEVSRPPRPHSNPGWSRSVHWDNNDYDEDS